MLGAGFCEPGDLTVRRKGSKRHHGEHHGCAEDGEIQVALSSQHAPGPTRVLTKEQVGSEKDHTYPRQMTEGATGGDPNGTLIVILQEFGKQRQAS
jgi:hypothetical protein